MNFTAATASALSSLPPYGIDRDGADGPLGVGVLQPSQGAFLRYDQLQPHGETPTEWHTPERHSATIHRAADTGPMMDRLTVMSSASHEPLPQFRIDLVRRDDPEQAYIKTDDVEIDLRHHHPLWGCVYFAMVCNCVSDGVFQLPQPKDVKQVAVKKLRKSVVHAQLRRGGQENPYLEAARLEDGDNIHTLKSVECLEDDEFLYIITPRACELGTLADEIKWSHPDHVMDESRIHQLFCKILQILSHLERRGLTHRDIKPQNFLFLSPNNLVLFDMAMSVRMPINPTTGLRTLQSAINPCGSLPWMCPEVLFSRVRDGVAVDVWAAANILYNLKTTLPLFDHPHPKDPSFALFVVRQGLNNPESTDAQKYRRGQRAKARKDEKHLQAHQVLEGKIRLHQQVLDRRTTDLLQNVLQVQPAKRFTLAQVMQSEYVRCMAYHR